MTTFIQQEFPLRCRVKMSRYLQEQLNDHVHIMGTVIGYGRNKETIEVLRDGYKSAIPFPPYEWTKIEDAT